MLCFLLKLRKQNHLHANLPQVKIKIVIGRIGSVCKYGQELITRSLQLPLISVMAFSQTDLFFSLNLSRIQIPTGASVTNCNHKHGLMLRHVQVRLHCSFLTEACSCTLEMAYFAGKIAKNRLVCKNAVALAYYGSCRLLVMGSWYGLLTKLVRLRWLDIGHVTVRLFSNSLQRTSTCGNKNSSTLSYHLVCNFFVQKLGKYLKTGTEKRFYALFKAYQKKLIVH